jgi:hypothetical protein
MATIKRIAAVVMGVGAFGAVTATAFADSVVLTDPLGGATLPQVLTNVINFLSTTIAIPLTVIMVLIGAFQMMTSAGNPEKFTKGRTTLLYAAIGFAVALLASGVTTLISNILQGH